MGYGLYWWRYVKGAPQNHRATLDALSELGSESGNLEMLKLVTASQEFQNFPDDQKARILAAYAFQPSDAANNREQLANLCDLPISEIKAAVHDSMPPTWQLSHDRPHESTWQGPSGAVQIYWEPKCVNYSMYGDFVAGAEALGSVMDRFNIPMFDPQSGDRSGEH